AGRPRDIGDGDAAPARASSRDGADRWRRRLRIHARAMGKACGDHRRAIGSMRASLATRLVLAGVAALIVAALLLVWIDAPLALYLHSYSDSAWVGFFAAITNLANGAIWYSLTVIAILICLARARFWAMPPERLVQCIRAWVFMVV